MIRGIRAGAVLAFFFTEAFAQSNEWPSVLTAPQPEETGADSAVVRVSTDASVFENYEKTSNGFEWTPSVPLWKVRQQCRFETSRDVTAHAMNQFYNFSGSAVRNGALPHSGDIGLEWTPISYLNLRQTGSAFNATTDVGPLARWNVREIPVLLRGGISGSGWNDSLPAAGIQNKIDALDNDVGYYGACAIGDPNNQLLGKGLYASAEAFGRSVSQAGLAAVMGSALYARRIGSEDSLFAFYGDSLSNGKEIPWGIGGGPQHYANTPWRIARSLQTAHALKMKERFGLRPAIIYSYTENSVNYPTLRTMLSTVKVHAHSLTMQLGTRDDLPVVYKGGLSLAWGAEEWLFGNDFTSTAMSHYKTSSQLDSLFTKLEDHQNYAAVSDHRVNISLPHAFSAVYTLSAFRESKTYTFGFFDKGQEFRNIEDNDRISIRHRVGVVSRKLDRLPAEVYGEYSEYLLNFLQSERSAQNFTERGYRIGLDCSYKPTDRFSIDERISAETEIRDYFYKKAHQNPFDPPPYQRRVTSLCTGQWKMSDTWLLNGRWNQSYNDYGFWYGKEYRPPGADSLKSDYYAIQNKRTDYSLEFGLGMLRSRFRMESGCLFRDIFNLRFNGQAYVADNLGLGKGYAIEPFTEIRLMYRQITLRGRIVRMINTAAIDKWKFRKNWDIRVLGQAAW